RLTRALLAGQAFVALGGRGAGRAPGRAARLLAGLALRAVFHAGRANHLFRAALGSRLTRVSGRRRTGLAHDLDRRRLGLGAEAVDGVAARVLAAHEEPQRADQRGGAAGDLCLEVVPVLPHADGLPRLAAELLVAELRARDVFVRNARHRDRPARLHLLHVGRALHLAGDILAGHTRNGGFGGRLRRAHLRVHANGGAGRLERRFRLRCGERLIELHLRIDGERLLERFERSLLILLAAAAH